MFIKEKEVKNKLINFKVTEKQQAAINELAKVLGMKKSEMFMYLLEQEWQKVFGEEELC